MGILVPVMIVSTLHTRLTLGFSPRISTPDSIRVYICKSEENDLNRGNYICK